ncbi:receptor-type tyrosine-protein phosphatase N2 [Pimephales promelas]|uniref:receptor-type tyrosine-protein phosphatase N2 n=1 Tax=Pimephales promelas TaxID=90988 RepID=UPI001955BA9C|nr:receptor-type tyrosine-protein phosphatase N2 [Pimephales promelas]KAG1960454.1 receptor-type tyrosine-protein phosphatase-like N [Pimephales promelas]
MGRMASVRALLLALLSVHALAVATADRKFGCLFEDVVCESYEVCINDRLFGGCQSYLGSVPYTYDVTPAAVKRLRNVLQKLAHRGYTWLDDTTQEVISKELSQLPKVPLGRFTNTFSIYNGNSRKLKAQKEEVSRTLQRYLQGFLPSDVASFNQSPQGQQVLWKYKGNGPHNHKGFMQLKEKPPSPHISFLQDRPDLQAIVEQPPQGQSFFTGFEQDRTGVPLAELQRHQAGPMRAQDPGKGQTQGKLRYFSLQRTPATKIEKLPGASKQPPKPQIEKLFFKSSASSPVYKEALSSVDEKFIDGVVNQLGRQSVNVDTLTRKDLDQLSKAITQALQVVDGVEGVKGREATQEEVEEKRECQESHQVEKLEDGTTHKEIQTEETGLKSEDKDKGFISQLLEFLDHNSGHGSARPPQAEEPFLGYINQPNAGSPLRASLENVQSRTTQKDLDLMRKKMEPDTLDIEPMADAEVEQWMHGSVDPPEVKAEVHPGKVPQNNYVEKEEVEKKGVRVEVDITSYSSPHDGDFGYIITEDSLSTDQGLNLMELLAERVSLHVTDFLQLSVLGPAVTFRVRPNARNISTSQLARVAVEQKGQLEKESGLQILEAGLSDRGKLNHIPLVKHSRVEPGNFLILVVVSLVFIVMVLAMSGTLNCLRHRSHHKLKEKLTGLGNDTGHDATAAYQDLCRQRMAVQTSERGERSEVFHPSHTSRINSVSSQFSDGAMQSPSARSSTSSWSEEPTQTNMDISTGHMILSYMEDHLQKKDRLDKEWEALCSYQAEPAACAVGQEEQNVQRNRPHGVLVYDHSRVILKPENNQSRSDYINASPIMDHDPRNPAYISAQGPLPSTVADFWQMVWESGCVVIVMLTPLAENGIKQCHQYWPDEGSDIYHIYEVNLVSEHIWCDDFLVRSFYVKNIQTNETRTVTQFHFLSWMDQNVPESARTLLDFRRKVNKCYRGRSCPIIVHCSDGGGRSGTYILIDMVLNKMAKGAKEIDIAATLEHLRDQRSGMVQTKEQFEFALTAVAEEVNAILKALPQ